MSAHPFPRHQSSTRFLYVPAEDWGRVAVGEKTEFRTRPREGSKLLTCALPTPVVAYTKQLTGEVDKHRHKLLVLTERRMEPVFNLSSDPDGLAREGFETYDDFRQYWKRRNGGYFKPMQLVYVWRFRDFDWAGDLERLGVRLMMELYGEHLGELAAA